MGIVHAGAEFGRGAPFGGGCQSRTASQRSSVGHEPVGSFAVELGEHAAKAEAVQQLVGLHARIVRSAPMTTLDASSVAADAIPAAKLVAARENFSRQDDDSMRACVTALGAARLFDSWPDLAGITAPALVIGRPGDVLHPIEMAETYATHLPHARLVVDDAPEPFFLRPDAYADLLVEFHA